MGIEEAHDIVSKTNLYKETPMDYTLLITKPTGVEKVGCATLSDVQNNIISALHNQYREGSEFVHFLVQLPGKPVELPELTKDQHEMTEGMARD